MTITGSCHCGATRFQIETAPQSVTACTCAFCSKTGALWAYYTPGEVKFTSNTADGLYAPNLNRHHFCAICGCTTFGESPTWSLDGTADFSKPKLAINARLLDDVDLARIPVATIDGRNLW
ncbi:MAG TPA: GFA family protein [Arsenicitalea sp.]|nr:GFA family protein [Arsenicitalea sp.]